MNESWLKMNQQFLVKSIQLLKIELASHSSMDSSEQNKEVSDDLLSDLFNELIALDSGMDPVPALNQIAQALELSLFERKFLLLCAGVELDAELASIVLQIQGGMSKLPCFSLALGAFPEAHWSALSPENPLLKWRLIKMEDRGLLTQSPCSIDEHILHYMAGLQYLHPKLTEILTCIEMPESKEFTTSFISEWLSHSLNGQHCILQITGSTPEEKNWMVGQAIQDSQHKGYRLDPFNLPVNFMDLISWITIYNRTHSLTPLVLLIDGSRYNELDTVQRQHLVYLLEKIEGFVILAMDTNIKGVVRKIEKVSVPTLTKAQQVLLWKNHLGSLTSKLDGGLDMVVSQFDLNGSSIRTLAEKTIADFSSYEPDALNRNLVHNKLWSLCVELTRPSLDGVAQRIIPLAYWDDLVLSEMEKSILKEIAVHVRHRQRVYQDWGFASKSNRGLGIGALFSGESGTGKTMAAEVLANELQMDLFRIDLSQVVNKYIGETEKNLKHIFDIAESSGAILLFDEADALFGKRSEIKDSHDRYANIEVSYLLQRIEEYKGLSILTTNLKNALDKAFLRRIRFIIHFPFPDMHLRAEIWKRIFPSKTPTTGLEMQRLATLNIAGGSIRNIALNATFIAAEQNRPVTMQDIQQAARKEYLKLEKTMSHSESILS